jgi:hypothetical protein
MLKIIQDILDQMFLSIEWIVSSKDDIREKTIEECAQWAESQVPDLPWDTGDEYRRGQIRGAFDAAMVIRRLSNRK